VGEKCLMRYDVSRQNQHCPPFQRRLVVSRGPNALPFIAWAAVTGLSSALSFERLR
jgi:hypothetical protein